MAISNSVRMLVIMMQLEEKTGFRTDNTFLFFVLFFVKAVLDTASFYIFRPKWKTSFLGLCSMSIVLFNWVMMMVFITFWLIKPVWNIGSMCFLLAFASATCRAVALPMIFLGFLDYWINDSYVENQTTTFKFVGNVALTFLMWVIAIFFPFSQMSNLLREVHFVTGMTLLVCEVEESILNVYTVLGLFCLTLLTMVPFWSNIPKWLRRLDKLFEAKDRKGTTRDFPCNKTNCSEEALLNGNSLTSRPPLWFSLTLGFVLTWMLYLFVSVACMLLGMDLPAYVSINLQWLECMSNFMAGLVFWIKHKTCGSQNQPPDNVCLWEVYWNLSQKTQQKQPVEVLVFNPTEEKNIENIVFLYV